jgi:hypothetical protein
MAWVLFAEQRSSSRSMSIARFWQMMLDAA